VFTHGVELGTARATTRDLRAATRAFVDRLAEANPGLRVVGDAETVRLAGRTALAVPLAGSGLEDEEEVVGLHTTFLSDGTLFYYLWVVPAADHDAYRDAFARVGRSIRLNEGR
jgi:hypothetical protein